jgi:hypothetical protein
MIYLINIIVTYLLSLITLSTFNSLRIFGVAPLLPLFFIVTLSYYRKGFEPILLAAAAGLYFELFSAYPFGFYLFLFLLSAVVVRYMFQEGSRSFSFLSFMLINAAALIAYYLAQIVILYIDKVAIGSSLLLPLVAGLSVNLICAILIYAFSGWYFDKLRELENVLKRR